MAEVLLIAPVNPPVNPVVNPPVNPLVNPPAALLVTLKQLRFDGRGHRALDDVSLRLSARSTFILGPNGAGKSVLRAGRGWRSVRRAAAPRA